MKSFTCLDQFYCMAFGLYLRAGTFSYNNINYSDSTYFNTLGFILEAVSLYDDSNLNSTERRFFDENGNVILYLSVAQGIIDSIVYKYNEKGDILEKKLNNSIEETYLYSKADSTGNWVESVCTRNSEATIITTRSISYYN